MLTLYIVRHGETDWNKEDRIQGRLNSHLTEKGRYNAHVLGERLKDIDFAKVDNKSKRQNNRDNGADS